MHKSEFGPPAFRFEPLEYRPHAMRLLPLGVEKTLPQRICTRIVDGPRAQPCEEVGEVSVEGIGQRIPLARFTCAIVRLVNAEVNKRHGTMKGSRDSNRGSSSKCRCETDDGPKKNGCRSYCSFAYSALACFRMGMSGSASFQRAKKSWYAALAFAESPAIDQLRARPT